MRDKNNLQKLNYCKRKLRNAESKIICTLRVFIEFLVNSIYDLRLMEMKRKMDAAKEEKRRQEALAERRANHVEATMRFQKGIKNFRANKGN